MEYRCTFRGKLKLENEYKEEKYFNDDIYVVGDNVEFSLENGYGVIDKLPERKNYISRKMPKIKGVTQKGRKKEQIIAANIDNTFIVTSVSSPQFNNRTLDRLLIISESCKTNPIIVINKIDIGTDEELNFWCDLYSNLNYEVILTSVITGEGMDEIKIKMANKVNLFIGHSGVGKSSILNCLDNNIIQRVGEVSEAWNKGKHTTVTSRLFLFDNDTMVIDTPGLKEIEPYGIEITDITHYFKEIAKHSEKCRYNDCTHTHEPDCRVKEAVNSNYISIERYNSYLRLIESIEKDRF